MFFRLFFICFLSCSLVENPYQSGLINLRHLNGSVAYAGNVKSAKSDSISRYYDSQRIFEPPSVGDDNSPLNLVTANALVWKKAFEMVGGFNESYPLAGGEDVDLGLRLLQVGKISYAPESVVLHDLDNGFVRFIKRFHRYGIGNRLVSLVHDLDFSPRRFRPNQRGVVNSFLALCQYLSLLWGYKRKLVYIQ